MLVCAYMYCCRCLLPYVAHVPSLNRPVLWVIGQSKSDDNESNSKWVIIIVWNSVPSWRKLLVHCVICCSLHYFSMSCKLLLRLLISPLCFELSVLVRTRFLLWLPLPFPPVPNLSSTFFVFVHWCSMNRKLVNGTGCHQGFLQYNASRTNWFEPIRMNLD